MKRRNNRRIQRACRKYFIGLGCTIVPAPGSAPIGKSSVRQFDSVLKSRRVVAGE